MLLHISKGICIYLYIIGSKVNVISEICVANIVNGGAWVYFIHLCLHLRVGVMFMVVVFFCVVKLKLKKKTSVCNLMRDFGGFSIL